MNYLKGARWITENQVSEEKEPASVFVVSINELLDACSCKPNKTPLL